MMEQALLFLLDWNLNFSTQVDYLQVILQEWDRFARTENLPLIRLKKNFNI